MEQDWPQTAAGLTNAAITKALHATTGNDGKLSRSKMGAARVKTSKGKGPASVEEAGSNGVWAIVNDGTRDHVVDAKPGSALRTPRGPRRRVNVAGRRGLKVWDKGVKASAKQRTRSGDQAFTKAVNG